MKEYLRNAFLVLLSSKYFDETIKIVSLGSDEEVLEKNSVKSGPVKN